MDTLNSHNSGQEVCCQHVQDVESLRQLLKCATQELESARTAATAQGQLHEARVRYLEEQLNVVRREKEEVKEQLEQLEAKWARSLHPMASVSPPLSGNASMSGGPASDQVVMSVSMTRVESVARMPEPTRATLSEVHRQLQLQEQQQQLEEFVQQQHNEQQQLQLHRSQQQQQQLRMERPGLVEQQRMHLDIHAVGEHRGSAGEQAARQEIQQLKQQLALEVTGEGDAEQLQQQQQLQQVLAMELSVSEQQQLPQQQFQQQPERQLSVTMTLHPGQDPQQLASQMHMDRRGRGDAGQLQQPMQGEAQLQQQQQRMCLDLQAVGDGSSLQLNLQKAMEQPSLLGGDAGQLTQLGQLPPLPHPMELSLADVKSVQLVQAGARNGPLPGSQYSMEHSMQQVVRLDLPAGDFQQQQQQAQLQQQHMQQVQAQQFQQLQQQQQFHQLQQQQLQQQQQHQQQQLQMEMQQSEQQQQQLVAQQQLQQQLQQQQQMQLHQQAQMQQQQAQQHQQEQQQMELQVQEQQQQHQELLQQAQSSEERQRLQDSQQRLQQLAEHERQHLHLQQRSEMEQQQAELQQQQLELQQQQQQAVKQQAVELQQQQPPPPQLDLQQQPSEPPLVPIIAVPPGPPVQHAVLMASPGGPCSWQVQPAGATSPAPGALNAVQIPMLSQLPRLNGLPTVITPVTPAPLPTLLGPRLLSANSTLGEQPVSVHPSQVTLLPQKRHLPEPPEADLQAMLKSLPQQGQLVKAVKDAGMLLQDLMMPQWRHPHGLDPRPMEAGLFGQAPSPAPATLSGQLAGQLGGHIPGQVQIRLPAVGSLPVLSNGHVAPYPTHQASSVHLSPSGGVRISSSRQTMQMSIRPTALPSPGGLQGQDLSFPLANGQCHTGQQVQVSQASQAVEFTSRR